MAETLYIAIVLATTIGIDWALYNGTYRSIRAFYRVPNGVNYRNFLFPRIILTLIAGVIVSVATPGGKPNVPAALTGFAIFLASSFYAQVRTFLTAERYDDDHDV
jgi:hypothetical protein